MRKLDTNLQNRWHLHGDENSRREKFKNSLPDPNGNEKRVNQTTAIKNRDWIIQCVQMNY